MPALRFTIRLWDRVNRGDVKRAGELRQWMDGYGLTPKGRAHWDPNGTYSWFGIAGTWFWIDPVDDLAFVGMVQHVNLGTTRGIHRLSRSLVYQSIMNN